MHHYHAESISRIALAIQRRHQTLIFWCAAVAADFALPPFTLAYYGYTRRGSRDDGQGRALYDAAAVLGIVLYRYKLLWSAISCGDGLGAVLWQTAGIMVVVLNWYY